MPLNVDLHSHSNRSDGALAPAQVAARAHANGVAYWALSDHDDLSGLAEAADAAAGLGLAFIAGVEISACFAGRTVHVLGLHVDPASAPLDRNLAGLRDQRASRAQQIAQRLSDCGIPDALDGALQHAANPALIGRVHFAQFLCDAGRAKSLRHAFQHYLGEGRPAFVPMRWASLEQAVAWIRLAGGTAVLAHPGSYRYPPLHETALLDAFKAAGGDAIEVITWAHTHAQAARYAQLARHYGLKASCGSDFHAPGVGRVDLGGLPDLPDDLTPVWRGWPEFDGSS